MDFLSLPNELIMLIGSRLETEQDIFALMRTNSRFYQLLLSSLYKRNVNCSSSSALSWCVSHGSEGGVSLLLRWGANLQYCKAPIPYTWDFDEDHGSALHFATSQTMAKYLLDNGADVNGLSQHGTSALHMAVKNGLLGMAKLLYNYGALVDMDSEDGKVLLQGDVLLHGAPSSGDLHYPPSVSFDSNPEIGRRMTT
jgi:ankyrin repeat protein